MTLSVVVPSYERPNLLQLCLAALQTQSRLPDEVVVVVRPSDAPTVEVVERLWTPLSIRPAWVTGKTIVAAEIAGISAASGEIIGFLDDDAIPDRYWCERIAGWYENEQVGAVGGPDGRSASPNRAACRTCGVRPWGAVADGASLIPPTALDVEHLIGCNMSVRKSLAVLDPALTGYCYRWELDLCLGVRRRGRRVVYDPAIRVEHPYRGRLEDPAEVRCHHCNNTYVLLKHLRPMWRAVFIAYTFLWGDTGCPGLGQFLLWLAKTRRARLVGDLILPSLVGKVDGMRLYMCNRGSGQISTETGTTALDGKACDGRFSQ